MILKYKKLIYVEKIKIFLKKLWAITYKSVFTFNLHNGFENAGYLAFSIIFAIFPFMIFFTILIGYFGQTEIGIKLIDILSTSLPSDITKTLLPVIDNVINGSKVGILSIATLTLMWSASSLVQELKSILDKAFRIKTNRSYLLGRLGSILKFLLITILIISAIFFTIIFPKLLLFVSHFIPIGYNSDNIFIVLRPLLVNLFMFLFIISIYYIIPSKQNKLKNVIWGSLLTLVGWSISLKILTFYLTKMSQFQVVYGSLAGIIITLFFFQIMATILIFSAEFNYHIKDAFNKS
ncbi:MAG: YihY/virulence factor BrkB family protein [Rickettsiales bacterium]|nr:YihY/virulence factor BrkB family protein [Rickettsiales bacterium]